jgi:hypothetical protein
MKNWSLKTTLWATLIIKIKIKWTKYYINLVQNPGLITKRLYFELYLIIKSKIKRNKQNKGGK